MLDPQVLAQLQDLVALDQYLGQLPRTYQGDRR